MCWLCVVDTQTEATRVGPQSRKIYSRGTGWLNGSVQILVGGHHLGKSTFAAEAFGERPYVHNNRVDWVHNGAGEGEPYDFETHTHIVFNDEHGGTWEPLLQGYVPANRSLFRSVPAMVKGSGHRPLCLYRKPIIFTENENAYKGGEPVKADTFDVVRVTEPLYEALSAA